MGIRKWNNLIVENIRRTPTVSRFKVKLAKLGTNNHITSIFLLFMLLSACVRRGECVWVYFKHVQQLYYCLISMRLYVNEPHHIDRLLKVHELFMHMF